MLVVMDDEEKTVVWVQCGAVMVERLAVRLVRDLVRDCKQEDRVIAEIRPSQSLQPRSAG